MSEEFVTIELSRKQVITSNLYHNEKTDKDYAKVLAPGGGSFLYPVQSLQVKKDDPEHLYFTRPVGTEIQVQYGHRIDGVPDSAPSNEKYVNEIHTWRIEDLKAAYEEAKREYAEQNQQYVNMTVPTEWGKKVSSEHGEFISISIPIDKTYYSFILPEDRFRSSDKTEGMSYFGFPKKKKESEEDYTVTLRCGVKNEDGSYRNEEREISSAQLKKYVDEAVEYANIKDLFVTTDISEKLVRPFTSKEGKELYSVAVPMMEGDQECFYEVVVPSERVKKLDDGKVRLTLFKNGPDGTAYMFTAKRSVPDGNGGYSEVKEKISSEQLAEAFRDSIERFMGYVGESHSLADELNEKTAAENQEKQIRRAHGRR